MYKYELYELCTTDKNINIFKDDVTECQVHTHQFIELIYICKGRCKQYIDGDEYEAHEGDLFFINYNQTHSFSEGENLVFYNIEYLPEFFGNELMNSENIYDIFKYFLLNDSEESLISTGQKISFLGKENEEIKRIIRQMEKEFYGKPVGYRNVLNSYSNILFSKILRKILTEKKEVNTGTNKLVTECMEYIDKNCGGKLSLGEIAQNTFYNPAYLSRIFKKYCGQNLWEYIRERRMTEAARLLKNSENTIEEIMEQVGYSGRKAFYKHFKEFYGLTPGEYKKSK